ncbi:MAG TPA: peptidylprolyl isomerase [Candidatus Polarisedimenticolaceae bacterium]|nr:peptidylprolyl isomerase [Candidatus Polarisedimenticolaceae bacterium]
MRSMRAGLAALAVVLLAAVPAPDALQEKAPDTFYAKFETTKGAFVVQVNRSWAPNGADRFYNLVKSGFYDGQRFFRVVKGFVVQWGIPGDPALAANWAGARIADDKVAEKNASGTITFAKSGPNSRTTQVFINLADNQKQLDKSGFAPFGVVVDGMDVVKKLHGGYGDMVSQGGRGVDVPKLYQEGNAYLDRDFPKLDKIVKATVQ